MPLLAYDGAEPQELVSIVGPAAVFSAIARRQLWNEKLVYNSVAGSAPRHLLYHCRLPHRGLEYLQTMKRQNLFALA